MPEQLTLAGITRYDEGTFDSFYLAEQETIVVLLQEFALGKGEPFIYLWGKSGTGKSHLLQACCNHANDHAMVAMYFSLGACQGLSPDLFNDLEQMQLVCLDDIEVIAGDAIWEEALFNLYNRLRDSGSRLLIGSNVLPRDLGLSLADLTSRLNWGPAFQLQSMDDDALRCALQFRATQRGITLSAEVTHFLLRRCTRDMKELFSIFDILDKAALANKHGLTIPFVKSVLKL